VPYSMANSLSGSCATVVTQGCRLCAGTEATSWGEENGYSAVRCTNCGLVYLSPWPDLSERDRALQYGAHAGDKTINTNARPQGRGVIREYHRALDDLYGGDLAGKRVKWIDIGCGYGEFLTVLKSMTASDSTLLGSEPNERKSQYARSRGLDVEYRDLDNVTQRFTHISLLNVFSHLPDPIDFLAKARDRLEPGGELVAQTGNAGDLRRSDVPGQLWFPDHLTFAGRQTLEVVMKRLDMDVISVMAYRSPALSPTNVAKDLVKRIVRPDHNPVDWRGPYRSLWLRAKRR
jgi:2-polyprenyl-3-methyl-5-hydroxy-6-metoxy-1,4-benzoquinol methylase